MKYFLSILLCALVLSCDNTSDYKKSSDDNRSTEGHEQVETPVMNSGAETERDRALESIEQDTTGKEVSVGKDSSDKK